MESRHSFFWLVLFMVVWLAAFLIYFLWPEEVTELPPGVRVPGEPVQTATAKSPWHVKDYVVTPLADYKAKVKILHMKWYKSGRESDLSPLDLAVGWGKMSNQVVVDALDISQSRRWYEWQADVLPLPAREISYSSANMHIIPASSGVEESLHALHRGDIVTLTGCLVEVKAADGWGWRSSLSRTDVGENSCELMWVEGVK